MEDTYDDKKANVSRRRLMIRVEEKKKVLKHTKSCRNLSAKFRIDNL